MGPIGWTLICALLATTFPKSATSSRCADCVDVTATNQREEALEPAKHDDVLSLTSPKDEVHHSRDGPPPGVFVEQSNVQEGQARTFGHKRIQFMLMPLMYKMGAMMTMLAVLTVISLKGLLIGAILLILKLSTIIAKFSSGWQHHAPQPYSAQPIHVHVHNGLPSAHQQAYNGWMPQSGPDDDQHYYYRG